MQREAIDETGNGNDFLYWNRSDFSKSPHIRPQAGWVISYRRGMNTTALRPPLSECSRAAYPVSAFCTVIPVGSSRRTQGLSGNRALERTTDALDGA